MAINARIGWLSLLVATGAAQAATLEGSVRVADKALAGAMLSITNGQGMTDSVYSDAAGHYVLSTRLKGALKLRVRKRYHRDEVRDVALGADAQSTLDVTLTPLTDAKELSDDHPSLSHFAQIDFDKDEKAPFSRANFTRDCLSCHSIGNLTTRWPRPPEGWVPTVQRMHGYLGNADMNLIKQRAERLSKALDGRLVNSRPEVPYDALLAQAKVHQFRLPNTVVPHDAEYSPTYDKVFSSEMFAGEVLETDLKSGQTLHFKLPDDGEKPGGEFTRRGLPAPYGLTIARAPHSLAEGPDGKIYLTDSIGAGITVFDPKSHAMQSYQVGGGALYPHTVRAAQDGIIWFTIAMSNQVGRFDPKTHISQVITLPATPSLSASGGPIPYGIDVSPTDGSVWYSKLASDKIGRIDAKTLEVKEFDSPVRGPRRQRFDAQGRLWVTGFSEGAIACIDVANWKADIYPLPRYAPNEIPAPYALAINPVTQEVWVNDTMLDLAWRFLPKEQRFVAYPMPLKGTYTRDFSFTPDGWACTANNPIPAAALEGGTPELVCIDPGKPTNAVAVSAR
ncbi:MAG: carboxypeptidase regulatory-like domain-containing protein [Gammaproteobacteria bacterium]|nr:carboxypeptidase regulatory-like domain-containing protein [Gammaproteobacteria bacterium]